MFCSISSGKSASNWLDRLRSSKGFPSGNGIDLEQFLNLQTHHNLSNSPGPKSSHPNAASIGPTSNSNRTHDEQIPVIGGDGVVVDFSKRNRERELFYRVGNVLAELFNMRDSNDFPRIREKKNSRKQSNPKIYVVSATLDANNLRPNEGGSPMLPSIGDNSRVELKEAKGHVKEDGLNMDEEEEDKSPHLDLSALSRTEVTVIDTSCPSWKFDKLLFRRKNVWKVRDKKSKAMNVGKRKRKASFLDDDTSGADINVKVSAFQRGSSKERNGEVGVTQSNDGPHHQSNKKKEECKEAPDIVGQVGKKSFPSNLKKGSSSVILIKSIPTSKKPRGSMPKSSLKSSQKQQKAKST